MGLNFKDFVEGGGVTVYPSGAGAPDLSKFLDAADKVTPVAQPAPRSKPGGPGM